MSLQVVEAVLSGITILGGAGGIWLLLRKSVALNEVANAQLTKNHGGSMLDKIDFAVTTVEKLLTAITANHAEATSQIAAVKDVLDDRAKRIEAIESALTAMTQQAKENNDDAKDQWASLHAENQTIRERVDVIDQVRQSLAVSLPAALAVQDKLVTDTEAHGKRLERLEQRVFGND